MVQIKYPDPVIVCDECKITETESEATAEAEGWLVDRKTEPHKHR